MRQASAPRALPRTGERPGEQRMRWPALALLLSLLTVPGCAPGALPDASPGGAAGGGADGPVPGPVPGLHNVYRLGDRLYSGSSPEGDAGFASLRKLGVKTVLSVDGARPDLERARRYGL